MMKQASKSIPNRERKLIYLVNKWNEKYCAGLTLSWKKDLHHCRIHNEKPYRKKYPLFIHSVWNLAPIEHNYHISGTYASNPLYQKWPEKKVRWFERLLERNPELARKVNMEE